jgi:sporulation-control protein spo0M
MSESYLTPSYVRMIFRINRDTRGVERGTLAQITMAGEHYCRLKNIVKRGLRTIFLVEDSYMGG